MLAVGAGHVGDRGAPGRDLVVGLAQERRVGAEGAERRVTAAPAGPRAAAAAVGGVVVGLPGEHGVAVGAGVAGAAHGMPAGALVPNGGYEGRVVGEHLVGALRGRGRRPLGLLLLVDGLRRGEHLQVGRRGRRSVGPGWGGLACRERCSEERRGRGEGRGGGRRRRGDRRRRGRICPVGRREKQEQQGERRKVCGRCRKGARCHGAASFPRLCRVRFGGVCSRRHPMVTKRQRPR